MTAIHPRGAGWFIAALTAANSVYQGLEILSKSFELLPCHGKGELTDRRPQDIVVVNEENSFI